MGGLVQRVAEQRKAKGRSSEGTAAQYSLIEGSRVGGRRQHCPVPQGAARGLEGDTRGACSQETGRMWGGERKAMRCLAFPKPLRHHPLPADTVSVFQVSE